MHFKILLQKIISFSLLIIIYPGTWVWLFVIKGYKINNLKSIRQEFKLIKQQIVNSKSSLLICPNHLTYIDSVLLLFAFGSLWDYLINFKSFVWNFPKIDNIKKNIFYQVLCYLSKCIFVNSNIITTATYLLDNKEYILLFPEGHRSLDGKVDTVNFAYGVGKLVAANSNLKVLGVYLRGATQIAKSNFPNNKDNFYCKLKIMDNLDKNIDLTNKNNYRTYRTIARNIINNLVSMEQDYFRQ